MNYYNRGINHNSAVDNDIGKPTLFELKYLIKQPYKNTYRQRQYTLYEEPHYREFHYPSHNRISLVESSRINQNLRAKPVAHI